ncbi:hypothetical protein AVEN_115201-1 [Araneus ventricosus]|uniref:Secreted protein n=1 Tax=Araneus ventricosus TaxID=182803 RepID=A0A4Y1ZYM8_ARAVE|nr:hypothetical protein AVEN_115201-1 [Araneus ventricosus]
MFTLPAVLYLKLLPLFGQCLYHLIVPNKSRPPHAGGTVPKVQTLPPGYRGLTVCKILQYLLSAICRKNVCFALHTYQIASRWNSNIDNRLIDFF